MASADIQTALLPTPLPAPQMTSFPTQLPILRSNQGSGVASASTGWMLATSLNMPTSEMRARYNRDGYIWIKNLVPREDVLDMREHYFSQFAHTGILKPNTSPRDGIFNPANDPLLHQGIGATPEAQTLELLDIAHATPNYRTFLQHPSLRAFVRDFMGWDKEVLVDRAMLRHNVPGSLSTCIHYDKLFLRAGEAEFLTAWVPIGDCAANGGGLMYLENSNTLGEEIEAEFMRNSQDMPEAERIDAFNKNMAKGGFLSHDAEEFGRVDGKGGRWLVGDYEAGDVVFHKPYMVHAATRNEDERGRIRLASDLRFYEEGAGLDRRWLRVWRHDDGL